MKTTTTYTLFALAACVTSALGQQATRTGGFSPIPTVAAGSTIPLDSKQFVFLGPRVTDLTISYPSELDPGGLSGQRRTYTIKMLNQVTPIVSTTVTQNGDGTFDYVYSIQNDPKALEAIKVWSIGMPATDALLSATNSQWQATSQTARGHEQALPGAVSMTPVIFAVWRDPARSGIPPGKSLANVTIRSAYRPGFTLLYARSDEDYNVPADLPVAVRAQLEVMRAPDWQNRAAVVIGPLFPKEWSRDIIANELKYGIARLTGQGRLTESSAFVTAIKSALDTISSAGGVGIPLDQVRSLARTPVEIDVVNAISLSLR
jgi:hypothetical protein